MKKWLTIALIVLSIIIYEVGIKSARGDFAFKSPRLDFYEFSIADTSFYPNAPILPNLPPIPPILQAISLCESGGNQYNPDKSLLRGKINQNDVGKFQINETYHLKTAKSMGIDIYSENGNIKYALYLYETQGTSPWKASSKCWSK